jgi:signal peptidase I
MTREHSSEYADVLLGPDQYYLLGDNRGNCRDSRDIGPVMRLEIEGKLVFRIYPVKRIGIPK